MSEHRRAFCFRSSGISATRGLSTSAQTIGATGGLPTSAQAIGATGGLSTSAQLCAKPRWAILLGLLLGLVHPFNRAVRAQEPSGFQAAASIESAMVDAIKRSEKSVVAIARVKRGQPDQVGLRFRTDAFGRSQQPANEPKPDDPDFIPNEYGTGVVIDRNGLILTTYHLLDEASSYYVTLSDPDAASPRKVYEARVKGADPRIDLAVLQIGAQDLSPIKFGDAQSLKKGQLVIALGNPYAIARDGQVSASWGIISNLGRKLGPRPADESRPSGSKETLNQFGNTIQTDARLNLGTSGGALVNLKGEMVGLTISTAAAAGYEQAAGYAIPVDATFRRAVETLKKGREVEYGFLGVSPRNLTSAESLTGKQGVRVGEVVDGTPAQRSGLVQGDVITHVNGEPIYDSDSLMLNIGKLPVESLVRLAVDRDGRTAPMTVELAKYFVPGKKIVTAPVQSWRGIRVDHATAVRDFFQRVARREVDLDGCVAITEVEPDSPAWQEGLRPEMFITHVGNTRVITPKEFHAAVAFKNGPVSLRLRQPLDDRAVRVIPAASP